MGKGQEKSLPTTKALDTSEKRAAGAQSDRAGKGMQAGKRGKDAAITQVHDGDSPNGRVNSLDEQEGPASVQGRVGRTCKV